VPSSEIDDPPNFDCVVLACDAPNTENVFGVGELSAIPPSPCTSSETALKYGSARFVSATVLTSAEVADAEAVAVAARVAAAGAAVVSAVVDEDVAAAAEASGIVSTS
jgi:hypothetical protein